MARFRNPGLQFALLALFAGLVTSRAAAFADKPPANEKPPVANQPASERNRPAPLPAVRTTPAPSRDSIPAPLAPEAIEEILRLRRAIGISDVLQGSTKDGTPLSSDEQFRKALQTLAGQAPESPATPAPSVRPRQIDSAPPVVEPTQEPARVVELIPSQSATDVQGNEILESSAADLAVVGALRDTSRLLDNRAHDLDAERRFDEAEKLRQLAARLRKDARRIESTALAHEASVSPQY